MAPTLTPERPVETREVPREHRDRHRRLLAERTFRLEQLADLDAEAAPSGRHESVRLALRMAGATALAEIDGALARLADGVYGRCLTCHCPIADERLDTLPQAALCTSCHWNEQNCRHRFPR